MREPILKTGPTRKYGSPEEALDHALAVNARIRQIYEQTASFLASRGLGAASESVKRLIEERHELARTLTRLAAEGGHVPGPAAGAEASLPQEIARSWEEEARSSLATAYRFCALGVEDAMRGFIYFSHLAAHAEDARTRSVLESLASEHLALAQRLRPLRRQAWRADPRNAARAVPKISSRAAFEAFLGQREQEIAGRLAAIAGIFAETGETGVLQALREQGLTGDGAADTSIDAGSDRIELLIRAQRPIERLVDDLEQILPQAGEEWRPLVEEALDQATRRLIALSRLTEEAAPG